MIESIKELRAMSYTTYLESGWWRAFRRLHIASRCERCGFQYELDLHHVRYQRLGNELASDVITLCRRCHADIHYHENAISPTERMILQGRQITKIDWDKRNMAVRKLMQEGKAQR